MKPCQRDTGHKQKRPQTRVKSDTRSVKVPDTLLEQAEATLTKLRMKWSGARPEGRIAVVSPQADSCQLETNPERREEPRRGSNVAGSGVHGGLAQNVRVSPCASRASLEVQAKGVGVASGQFHVVLTHQTCSGQRLKRIVEKPREGVTNNCACAADFGKWQTMMKHGANVGRTTHAWQTSASGMWRKHSDVCDCHLSEPRFASNFPDHHQRHPQPLDSQTWLLQP